MTVYHIIFGIAALFGISRIFRMNDLFAQIILSLQVIAIAVIIVYVYKTNEILINISLFLTSLAYLLILVYGLIKKGFNLKKRALVLLPGLLMFALYLFRGMHWPGSAYIIVSMFIPLICYLVMIFDRRESYKNEIGIMSILAVDAGVNYYMFLFLS